MRSTSLLLNLPALSAVIVMDCDRPDASSEALTDSIPLASTSKVTLTRGTPLGAGAMPPNEKSPNNRLCAVNALSPSKTLTSTPGWLSWWVVKTFAALAGIVVFRSINLVITPPAVSMPNDNGATSNNTKPPSDSPAKEAAWTAAPYATASSGFREQFSVAFCALLKNASSFSRTRGTRVEPPTSTISSTSFASTFASLRTRLTDLMDRSNNGSHKLSNFDRVMSRAKSSPLYKASTSILVFVAADSSLFARSQAR
mmetsp:Transcript_11760/g.34979  ORF Transcript_11760/g.34979 Transcript_11760/m.34979 type:complete len:256 (-) Transcript_11760:1116-1883(-)